MFNNIGDKICLLAKIVFFVSCGLSVIGAIIVWAIVKSFWLGLLVLLIVPLVSYIFSLFIYEIGDRNIKISHLSNMSSNKLFLVNEGGKKEEVNKDNKIDKNKIDKIKSEEKPLSKPLQIKVEKTPQYELTSSLSKLRKNGDWICQCGHINSKESRYCSACFRKK